MIKTTIALIGLLLYSACTLAQIKNGISVKAGEIPDEVIPFNMRYEFTAFKQGTATLRSGTSSTQSFNYNCLLDEMQFITNSGDTLAIAAPAELRAVTIDSSVFYYHKGYLKQLKTKGNYILAIKKAITQVPDKKKAAYNTYSGTSSISTYSSVVSGDRAYALQVNREVIFVPVEFYFLGDSYGNFRRADKKTFLQLFSEKRVGIQEYIKEHNINFNKLQDIYKLFEYCAS